MATRGTYGIAMDKILDYARIHINTYSSNIFYILYIMYMYILYYIHTYMNDTIKDPFVSFNDHLGTRYPSGLQQRQNLRNVLKMTTSENMGMDQK